MQSTRLKHPAMPSAHVGKPRLTFRADVPYRRHEKDGSRRPEAIPGRDASAAPTPPGVKPVRFRGTDCPQRAPSYARCGPCCLQGLGLRTHQLGKARKQIRFYRETDFLCISRLTCDRRIRSDAFAVAHPGNQGRSSSLSQARPTTQDTSSTATSFETNAHLCSFCAVGTSGNLRPLPRPGRAMMYQSSTANH